jgi:uncharacterized membrane protein YeaQ/YmgE (transglycosylase-associated protein family)
MGRGREPATPTMQPVDRSRVETAVKCEAYAMSIIWLIVIGFIAGVVAKLITPGRNEPSGFILTTLLGIGGAFVATYLGQAIGWYRAGETAGFIGATVGAIIVLLIWGMISSRTASRV